MLHSVLSSMLLVALSEMGDKTQLLAFSLAIRFKKPIPILAGIFVATILNHGLASTAGQWIATQFSEQTLSLILGVSFIAFGIWTLIPDQLDKEKAPPKFGPFITTTILFFLAEMGDKTQLATVALAAKYQSLIAVTIGTTLGMMIADGPAVFLGDRLSQHAQHRYIRWIAASLFFIFGILSLLHAKFGKISLDLF